MNAQEAFRRAADLYLQARDVPPGELDAFLDRACAGDAALRSEVRRLLDARDAKVPFETLAGRLAPVHAGLRDDLPSAWHASSGATPSGPFELSDAEDTPNAQVGNYRLLERIGEGGFGRVWVAEQSQPVRRRVALKVIKAGMDSREVLSRFEQERQALAVMDHPHVAKVFDAGVTARGRPFFVMEHVPGAPITDFCDSNRLRVRQRLSLFIPVCEAVQHAHQKGIIHRDLKPSNILVTLVDGQPLPKVIDFGIAKATSSPLIDRTVFTELGQMMGTPEYMSPEQAAGGGEGVDTRSDVYSLGVVLYRLMTGTLPFDARMLRRAGSDGIIRIIQEMEPQRPSTRISALIDESRTQASSSTPAQIEGRHGIDAHALQRELRGELDWIVMKCLEKDRARRYGSASELAADLRRFLVGEPVVAAPPSTAYRVSKLIRRNRVAVAGAATVLLALTLGLAVSTYLFFQERDARRRAVAAEGEQSVQRVRADAAREAEERERRNAEQERDAARTEKAKAQQISTFLQDMLAAIQPVRARGNRDVTVAEALDDASARVARGELGSEPAVEAAVRLTIGSTYCKLGKYPPAREHLETALSILRKLHGDEHADIAAARLQLGSTLYDMGEYAAAEAHFRQALTLSKLFAADSAEVAGAEHVLGKVCCATGKLDEAQSHYDNALRIYRNLLAPESPAIIEVMGDLGSLYYLRGDHEAADPLWRDVLAHRRNRFGEDDLIVAICYNNLATARSSRGDYPGAIEYHQKALAIRRKLLGPEHAETGHSLRNLATCVSIIGDPREAESLYREALAIQRRTLSPDHPQIATTLDSLGVLIRVNGKLEEAVAMHNEALTINRRALGREHPAAARSLQFLGVVLLEQDKVDEAEAALLEARAMRRRTVGRDDILVAENCIYLGLVYLARKEFGEAETAMREGIALIRKLMGEDHPRVAQGLSHLAGVLSKKGDQAGAIAANTTALEIFSRRGMGEQRDASRIMYNLGLHHMQRGAPEAARPLLEQALAIQQKLLPQDHPATQATLTALRDIDAAADN